MCVCAPFPCLPTNTYSMQAPQTSPVSLTRRQPALAHEAIRQLLEVTESLAEAAL